MQITDLLRPSTTYRAVLGRVIVNMRKKANIEQSPIAISVGVTQSTWSRIERGENSLTIDQLAKVADFLNIKASEILIETEKAVESLEHQGVTIDKNKVSRSSDNTPSGLALIGAAALGALVATAISNSKQ